MKIRPIHRKIFKPKCLFCNGNKLRPYYPGSISYVCGRCDTRYLFKNKVLASYYFSVYSDNKDIVYTAYFYMGEEEYLDFPPGKGKEKIKFAIGSTKGMGGSIVESTSLPQNINPFNLLQKLKVLLPFS